MIEIWIVDDRADRRDEVTRDVKNIRGDIKVMEFEKAQDAVSELARRDNDNKALPMLIVLDRNLAADRPPYNIGENVVRKLKNDDRFQNIKILAHSSIPESGDDMVAAGADIAIPKTDPIVRYNYLNKLINI